MPRQQPAVVFRAAWSVGTGYYVRYVAPEREDDGQGAVVGHDERFVYCPTLRGARDLVRNLLRGDPEITYAAILKPVEYARRAPAHTRHTTPELGPARRHTRR